MQCKVYQIECTSFRDKLKHCHNNNNNNNNINNYNYIGLDITWGLSWLFFNF